MRKSLPRHLEVEAEVGEVVLAADGVHAEEMPREALAEPVAGLGLHEPVLPAVAVDRPGVELVDGVEGPLRGQAYLRPDVGAQQCVVDEVGFHGYILRAYSESPGREDSGQGKSAQHSVSDTA